MVFCTYCGQPFFRAERLERHILTRKSGSSRRCYHIKDNSFSKDILSF